MRIAPLHDEFLSYLEFERGCSELTICAYRSDCRLFLRWIEEEGQEPLLDAVSRQTIRRYMSRLRHRGLKATSIARHLNSLRSFWKYLRDNEYVERDPFLRISVPKCARPLPVYLSVQECAALLDATERQRSAFLAFRDKAALSVLIFTGVRRAELLGLRLPSLNLEEGTLRVEQGKGRKARLLPLADQAVEALRDWLEVRPECDHDHLFTSRGRRPLGRKGLMGALRRALDNARIERDGVTLHKLRHTFACLMLQAGCDLFSLSQLLGHTRLDTTATYLHANVEDLRPIVDRHPLNTV